MNNPKTKQKRKYCGWTSEDMERALTAYKEKQCDFNEYCRRYNITESTFRSHLRCSNQKANKKVQSMGRLTVFTAARQCIPLLRIFKRKLMDPELAIGAYPGAIITISDTEHPNQAADNKNQIDVGDLENTENGRKSMSVNESQLSQSNKYDLFVAIDGTYPLPEQLTNENKRKLSQPAVILSSVPYKDDLENQ
ncbi:hypothetical protein JTB14_011074 [Gonioctena quinquepunctata]|nr:hypothetical protein JTB14_011074 [Gonioctena quinquepunctata]